MQECRIYEPSVAVNNNNCCRVCGIQKTKKEFRKIWKLRSTKLPIKLMCKACQKLWAVSRTMITAEPQFIVNLV
jgi:hypothetical protein